MPPETALPVPLQTDCMSVAPIQTRCPAEGPSVIRDPPVHFSDAFLSIVKSLHSLFDNSVTQYTVPTPSHRFNQPQSLRNKSAHPYA
jgi:hypothetical protein